MYIPFKKVSHSRVRDIINESYNNNNFPQATQVNTNIVMPNNYQNERVKNNNASNYKNKYHLHDNSLNNSSENYIIQTPKNFQNQMATTT